MAKKAKWTDDYWLLLMQIYLQKPVGIKPVYNRLMVELSLELHIAPRILHDKMKQLARLDTPRIERFWRTYSGSPKKLARAVSLWHEMRGYGNAGEFYEGVEVQETFERDFKPVNEQTPLTPVMLILTLDLYFRLTPITMVSETPEVQELAKLMKVKAADVVEVLDVFQHCDPYLNRRDVTFSSLLMPCTDIWRRYGNGDTDELAAYAEELKEYFR